MNYISSNRLKMKLMNMKNYLMTVLLKLHVYKEYHNSPTIKHVLGQNVTRKGSFDWQLESGAGCDGTLVQTGLIWFGWFGLCFGGGWANKKHFLTKNICTVD